MVVPGVVTDVALSHGFVLQIGLTPLHLFPLGQNCSRKITITITTVEPRYNEVPRYRKKCSL